MLTGVAPLQTAAPTEEKKAESAPDAARQAELTTQKAIGPDGELQKHREAVQHLSSQALQTQATLDTLKKERALLEELKGRADVVIDTSMLNVHELRDRLVAIFSADAAASVGSPKSPSVCW
jgi:UPF0042 nucleotide-binding protein